MNRSALAGILACTLAPLYGEHVNGPAQPFSFKYRESVNRIAGHSEHETKLGYTRPLGESAFDLSSSWRAVDGEKTKHELEGGVLLHNSWHPGAGFMHQLPTGKDYFEVFASKYVSRVNLSVEALYAVDQHPGWAKLKMKAEVPIKTYHGVTFCADVKHYHALSHYEKGKTSVGLSVKTNFAGNAVKRLFH